MTGTTTTSAASTVSKAKQNLQQGHDDMSVDVSKLITLVHHSVRFPDPALPNKPEFFSVPDPGRNIMSFGRIKLFNDDVLHDVFGETYKADSPIYKMKLIRSRLQAFIDQYTFPYMNGLGNALPDAALEDFRVIVNDLESQYSSAKELYENNWSELREASIAYFENNPGLYPGIEAEDMKSAITNKLLAYQSDMEKKFLFQVVHFDIKAIEMDTTKVDVAEKQAIINARNEVATKAGNDLTTMMNEFKSDVKNELRQSAVTAFSDLLKSIEKDQWNQKSINAVLKYIDKFDKLNFLNDKELEIFLSGQKTALAIMSAQDIKKDSDSIGNLHNVVTNAVGELKQLAAKEKQAIQDGFGAAGNRIIDPF